MQDAPFFTVKLKVQTLPCVIMFINGIAADRVVGFEELGGTDHWETSVLEKRLLKAGVVKPRQRTEDESESDEEHEQVKAQETLSTQGLASAESSVEGKSQSISAASDTSSSAGSALHPQWPK